jgi:hypothetical protein
LINSLDEKESGFSSLPNTSLVKIGIFKLDEKDYLYVETDDQELLEKPTKLHKSDFKKTAQVENTKSLEKEVDNNYQKT